MRAAIIHQGIVENIIIAGDDFDPGEGRELVALAEDSPVSSGWSYDGTAFAPAPPAPVEVPQEITARQARLVLLHAGLLETVKHALASLPGVEGEAARIEWEYATEIRRDSPLIGALAPMLVMTEAQVDALFVSGAAL